MQDQVIPAQQQRIDILKKIKFNEPITQAEHEHLLLIPAFHKDAEIANYSYFYLESCPMM